MTFRDLVAKSLKVDGALLSKDEADKLLEQAIENVITCECPGNIFLGARDPLRSCNNKCSECWDGEAFGYTRAASAHWEDEAENRDEKR